MNTARVTAYAKLNLTLDITGREAGYHLLDSLVCSIDLSDLIVVRRRRDRLVNVYMHGMGSEEIPPEQNNAFRAAEAFVKEFSTPGADITVYKNIPIGAGLGGSSADAAGAINALAKLYGVADRAALRALAAEYGSDTAYMLDGRFARIRGRGEKIERLEGCPRLYFLLICPESGVSAGQCYAEWDEMGNGGNVEDALAYAKQKNIAPLLWYNSSTAWCAFGPLYRLNKPEMRQKEFAWLESMGVKGIKVDFFSQDSISTMNYFVDILEDAAKYHLMVNFHGAPIPRGWQRTYPHMMSVEGVYGAEWYNNKETLTDSAAWHNCTSVSLSQNLPVTCSLSALLPMP